MPQGWVAVGRLRGWKVVTRFPPFSLGRIPAETPSLDRFFEKSTLDWYRLESLLA